MSEGFGTLGGFNRPLLASCTQTWRLERLGAAASSSDRQWPASGSGRGPLARCYQHSRGAGCSHRPSDKLRPRAPWRAWGRTATSGRDASAGHWATDRLGYANHCGSPRKFQRHCTSAWTPSTLTLAQGRAEPLQNPSSSRASSCRLSLLPRLYQLAQILTVSSDPGDDGDDSGLGRTTIPKWPHPRSTPINNHRTTNTTRDNN